MANWETNEESISVIESESTEDSNESTIRILDYEKEIDTNPDLYCERATEFAKNGDYQEAENEYLKAIEYSGNSEIYIYKLMSFYYSIKRKEYTEKGNKLYWGIDEHKLGKLRSISLFFLIFSYVAFSLNVVNSLIFLLPFVGLLSNSRQRIWFIHSARKEIGKFILKAVFSGIIAVLGTFLLMISVYENGAFVDGDSKLFIYGDWILSNICSVIGLVFLVKCLLYYETNCIAKLKNGKISSFIKKYFKFAKAIIPIAIVIFFGIISIQSLDMKRDEISNRQFQDNLYDALTGDSDYNIILTDEELVKRDELDEKYERKTDVDIRVIQVEADYVKNFPKEKYIWLILWDYGSYVKYELSTNCLYSDDGEALFEEVKELYEGDDEDYKKCKKFYKLAYEYSKKAVETESSTIPETSEKLIENQVTESIVTPNRTDNYNKYVNCSNMTSNEKLNYVVDYYGCTVDNITDITDHYLYPTSSTYDAGWAELARNGAIGIYEYCSTYIDNGEVCYGGASYFALVLYENGIIKRYHPYEGSAPILRDGVQDSLMDYKKEKRAEWDINMNTMLYAMTTNSSIEDVVENMEFGMEYNLEHTINHYNKSQQVSVIGKRDGVKGNLSYSEYYGETGCNIFEWVVNQPLNSKDVIELFNVTQISGSENLGWAQYMWSDKMEIYVEFGDETKFVFSLPGVINS